MPTSLGIPICYVHAVVISVRTLWGSSTTSAFVSRVLGGDLPNHAFDQVALGLSFRGFCFRKDAMLAAPAHLAFLVEARPCVIHLFKMAHETGITLPEAVTTYDSGIARAKEDCLARLSQAKAPKAPFLEILCDQAAEAAFE